MEKVNNPSDKKHVVVQNGQRVTGCLEAQEAQTIAANMNKLNENVGNSSTGKAKVVQNLCG